MNSLFIFSLVILAVTWIMHDPNNEWKIIITTKQENKLSKKIPPNYFKTIESLIEIEVEAEKIAEERYKKSPKKNPPLLKLLKSKNKPKED